MSPAVEEQGRGWRVLAVCVRTVRAVRACLCAVLYGPLWGSPTHTSLGALEGARKVYVIRRTPGNGPGRHPVDCRAVLGDEAQVNVDA